MLRPAALPFGPSCRATTCLLVLLAGTLASARAEALPERTFVLAVGNNAGDPGEVALRFAQRDASVVAAGLQRLGEVARERTKTLLGADADTFRSTFAELRRRLELEGREATGLVVYYSGHADIRSLHMGGSHLPFEELESLVEDAPAELKILIVDACHAGVASRVKGMGDSEAFEVRTRARTAVEGMAVITSSAAGEASQESDRLRSSFFSHHFMGGLRGAADENGDGRVTLAETYAYAYAQTLRSTGRTRELQHPTFAFDLKGRGEVIMSRVDRSGGEQSRLRLPDEAVYLIAEDEDWGRLVAEVAPSRKGAVVTLPAGRYYVQERRAREFREYEIDLPSGDERALSEVPYRSIRYDQLVRRRGSPERLTHAFEVLAGARGGVLPGEGVTPQLVVGYGTDLAWMSVGARVRLSTIRGNGEDGVSPRRHNEIDAQLLAQRYVDFRHLSVSLGLVAGVAMHHQSFSGERGARSRLSASGSFGALGAIERRLVDGLGLRLELGPQALIIRQAELEGGAERGTKLATPVTWWTTLGLRWRP